MGADKFKDQSKLINTSEACYDELNFARISFNKVRFKPAKLNQGQSSKKAQMASVEFKLS